MVRHGRAWLGVDPWLGVAGLGGAWRGMGRFKEVDVTLSKVFYGALWAVALFWSASIVVQLLNKPNDILVATGVISGFVLGFLLAKAAKAIWRMQ